MKKISLGKIYLWILVIISYLPIAAAVIYSFNSGRMSTVWEGFSLKWYGELFRDRAIGAALLNSVILGVVSSIISAFIATAAALGFKKYRQPLAGFFKGVSMIPIMIPEIILGMAYLVFFRFLGLPFGMLTLITAHTAFCIPYMYTQMSARVAGMDGSPAEAARLLGAGPLRAFFDVTLPYLMPALVSGMLLSFAMSFDDVIISMFVTGVTVNTLPIKVYSQVKTGFTPKINALCTVMIPAALICICLSGFIKRKKKL